MSSVAGVNEFSLENAQTPSMAIFGAALSLGIWGARKVFIAYFPSLEGSQLFEKIWPDRFSAIESMIWGGIFCISYQLCLKTFKHRHVFESFALSVVLASIPFAPAKGIAEGFEHARPMAFSFAVMLVSYLALAHFRNC